MMSLQINSGGIANNMWTVNQYQTLIPTFTRKEKINNIKFTFEIFTAYFRRLNHWRNMSVCWLGIFSLLSAECNALRNKPDCEIGTACLSIAIHNAFLAR